MILLTTDEVISLQEKLISKTGGSYGVRDIGLLESALFSCENSFDNVEQYPSVEEKSARLMYALTSNHAFVDGNKRIGVFVMLMTLELNSISLKYAQNELIELSMSVADGCESYDGILKFIKNHKQNSELNTNKIDFL